MSDASSLMICVGWLVNGNSWTIDNCCDGGHDGDDDDDDVDGGDG